MIGDDLLRLTIVREYVSKVKLGYSWSIDFFSARDEQCCFGAVMVGNGEYCKRVQVNTLVSPNKCQRNLRDVAK